MRRTTLSLTLAIALGLCTLAPADASARRAASSRERRADGTSARARSQRRKTGAKTSTTKSPAHAPAIAVTELDIEGLQRLLARDSDPAKARPLLVNFWATWCDPCRDEFPDLVKVNNDYKGRGLEFAVVSGDDISEIKTGVPKFLRQMRAGMTPYLLNVPDMNAAINIIDQSWGGELPATYLYDRTGRIAFKHFGRVDPKELRAEIDKVLAAN